jgi:uncharacterized iron-regulated protein
MSKLNFFVILAVISVYTHAESTLVSAAEIEHPPETAVTLLPVETSPALDLNAFSTVERIIPVLAEGRVVFIGEQHTRYDHHLTQLEIIRRLHALHPQLAIGMETFQQPFQRYLDEYIAGSISEQEMLRATEYYRRWRLDYRHYAPILRYAREHRLPLLALNVPTELTREVGRVGIEGLNEEDRQQLPDNIEPADESYRQRLKAVFEHHPNHDGQRFEHFLEAQLLWDEGMAEHAAAYLMEHPDHHLVVIAGNQHIAWGSAIPHRLQRRLNVPAASVLNSWDGPVEPGLADYLLMPAERPLPRAGLMGALLEDGDNHVTISACDADSACAAAGIKAGDRITAINDNSINSIADLRLAMWDKLPGDIISIAITRDRLLLPDKNLSYELTLK